MQTLISRFGKEPEICISHMLPGDATAAAKLKTTLWLARGQALEVSCLEPNSNGFKSWLLCLLAEWVWGSSFSSLNLSFLFCVKMIIPTQGVVSASNHIIQVKSSAQYLVHNKHRRQRGTKEPLDEGERGEWKTQHSKTGHGIQLVMASNPITSWQIDGEKYKQWQILFSWASKSLWTVTVTMKLKEACSLEEKLRQT